MYAGKEEHELSIQTKSISYIYIYVMYTDFDMLVNQKPCQIQGGTVGLWEKGSKSIIGTVNIVDCIAVDKSSKAETYDRHRVSDSEHLVTQENILIFP